MLRFALSAAVISASLVALPASAAPVVETALPAITAKLDNGKLHVRLTDGVIGHTSATSRRIITVEAFNAAGVSLGGTTAVVHKRITYATIKLAPAFSGADRFVVSAR